MSRTCSADSMPSIASTSQAPTSPGEGQEAFTAFNVEGVIERVPFPALWPKTSASPMVLPVDISLSPLLLPMYDSSQQVQPLHSLRPHTLVV